MATLALLCFSPSLPRPELNRFPNAAPSSTAHLSLRLKPAVSIASWPSRPRSCPTALTPKAYGSGGGGGWTGDRSTVPASERLISAAAYTLPFLDSLHYGRFLFARFPAAAALLAPLFPLAAAYRSIPYAAFVAFFALYLGVARNQSIGRFARFNAMQAVVLDVLLALPALLQRLLGVPSAARGVGFRIMEVGYNVIFVFSAVCFVYSIFSCILGRTPSLPLVASAADRQL